MSKLAVMADSDRSNSRCGGFLYSAFPDTFRAFRRIDFATRLRWLFDLLKPRAIASGANDLNQHFTRSFHGITLPRRRHLVAFEVLAGYCCGTVAKQRPIFQPGKRGSDLLCRLGEMERRYESARGCRGSSSLNPLIVVRREV